MSFGFGVGDFIAVIRTANKIRQDFSGAPVQLELIAAEVKSLALITQDIDVFLAGHNVDASQEAFLHNSESSCSEVLSDIEKVVSKYSTIKPTEPGARQQARRFWHRLKYEPQDVRDLRSRITSNLVALNAFWETLNRSNVVKILDRQDKQQSQEILDWLAEPDFMSQHHEYVQSRLLGTGDWLLQSPQYSKWIETKGDYLYLHGIPGGGKSTLVSMIIEDLYSLSETQDGIGICYYYSAFGRGQDHFPAKVLMCLIRQLAQGQPKFPPCIEGLYLKHTTSMTIPSLEELDQVFKILTESLQKVYIVIDALDEFDNVNHYRATLIREILELRRMLGANILLTSRSIPLIMNEISGMEALTIRADDEDVKLYIRNHLDDLPKFVAGLPDLQSEIETAIAHAADGMFLLAKLQLDSLRYKRSPRELRKALPAPGRAESVYANAYKKTMSVICNQHPDLRELAMDALGLIVSSKRHLKIPELLHALALEVDDCEFHDDNIPDIQDIISASCGLIALESKSNSVHLVHKTAQDYLANSPWLKNANIKMGKTCISYLLLSPFDSGPCMTMVSLLRRIADHCFYSYASCYWGQHVSPDDEPIVKVFLENQEHVQAAYQVFAHHHRRDGRGPSSVKITPGFLGFHLAAVLGLSTIIANKLERGIPMLDDDCGRGVLSYAAEAGHESIISLLISRNIEADKPDKGGRTPLSYAAEYGHKQIVSLLLKHGARIDFADTSLKSPLSHASKRGHADVVSILLRHKARCHTADSNMRTPLMLAAYNGHPDVVDVLLADGAVVDARNAEGQTALSEAAAQGNNDVATLLLAYGANVDSQDGDDCTPLFLAVAAGHAETVAMLIRANATIDLPNSLQQTPLSCAAELGDKDLVALLAANGAQLNFTKSSHVTPLYYAVNQEHYEVALYLLEHGADPTANNTGGWTALHLAAAKGNMRILEVLLESEQRGNARAIVEQVGANQSPDSYVRKDMVSHAKEVTTQRSAKKYGTKSNTIQSRLDNEGRNALHLAAACFKLDAMKYLAKSGSDIHARDKRGKGILEHACCSGSFKTVNAVFDTFELNHMEAPSSKSWSSLHWACLRGDLTMIKKLIHSGVKFSTVVTDEPDAEWTPLDVAIYYCNTNLISGEDGSLLEQHTWIDLIGAGLVEFDENSERILPVRRNALKPAVKIFYGTCDGCLQEIRGYCFQCRQCQGFDYCFMCKHDSLLTHPDHDWIIEKPEDLATNTLARPYSNLTSNNVSHELRRKAAQSWS